jgi:hypothetical protein
MISRSRRVRALGGLLVLATGVTGASACGGGGGGTGRGNTPPPTTVSINASTSFPSSGGTKCTDRTGTQWGATPVAVPAGPGKSTSVAETDPPTEWFPTGDRCVMQHSFSGLQPGRWRIWVAAGTASGVCESDLKAGWASVSFSNGACSVTP